LWVKVPSDVTVPPTSSRPVAPAVKVMLRPVRSMSPSTSAMPAEETDRVLATRSGVMSKPKIALAPPEVAMSSL